MHPQYVHQWLLQSMLRNCLYLTSQITQLKYIMLNAKSLFNQIGFHRYFYALFTLQSFSHFGRVPSWAWPVGRWRRKKGSGRSAAAPPTWGRLTHLSLLPFSPTDSLRLVKTLLASLGLSARPAGGREIVWIVSGFECTLARQKLQKMLKEIKRRWQHGDLKYKLII